jgi:hypothetical protein
MQIAARNGRLDVMKKLFECGADIKTLGPDAETLFLIAGAYGHINVLLWLLEQGADPNAVNDKGHSLVHVAARKGEVQVLKFLYFYCHADFYAADADGKSPLQSVPRYGPDNIPETKQFINMVTAPSESRDLHMYTLEREISSLRRYLIKGGLLSASAVAIALPETIRR